MKDYLLILSVLVLSGCEMTSEQYADVRKLCSERQGQYFMVAVPTLIGARIGAGCLENSK